LPDIIASIPAYYNRALKIHGPTIPHGEIKARMESYFGKSLWPKLAGRFQRYEFENYEGTHAVTQRTGDESGGWRVSLINDGVESFIFARGSRTEAGVWRLIVDSPDPALGEVLEKVGRDMFDAATTT
jgi:hypothetical protein